MLTGCGPAADIPEPFIPKNHWERLGLNGKVKKIKGSSPIAVGPDTGIHQIFLETATNYSFNKSGFIKESSQTNNTGAVLYKKVMIYKENGVPSAEIAYDFEGNLTGKKIYRYNDNGMVSLIENLNTQGQVVSEEFFKHELPGRVTESKTYNSEGELIEKVKISYNNTGDRTTFKHYDAKGKLKRTIVETEDEKFRMVEYEIKLPNRHGSVYKYYYKEDNKGNWIKKTITENDIPYAVEHREYEYYKR